MSRLPGFLQALSHRSFRLLWAGAFLSSVGTWIQDVALAWLIHVEFQNPVYLGLRQFAADVPLISFMLLGGVVADRIDRRRILLVSQVLQMAFALALAALYGLGWLGLGAILLIAFLTGLAQSQSAPTYQAVITTLVPAAQIPKAVALNSLQFNLSRTLGPVVAGLLLASAGITFCFLANALSFLAVIFALWRIEMPPPHAAPSGGIRANLAEGLRYAVEEPTLGLLMLLAAAGSFFAFPLVTYLPVVADETIGTGAAGYSALMSAFGAGAILGAIATAQRGNQPGRGRLLLHAFLVYGATSIGALVVGRQLPAMALLAVAGASLVTAFSTLNSLVQELAPNELRGRVVSIYGLAFRGGAPLGSLLAGVLVARLGAPLALAGYSGLLITTAAVARLQSKRLAVL
ncbi:MAG: MFS transporter [Vicinamibacteria bacterium]